MTQWLKFPAARHRSVKRKSHSARFAKGAQPDISLDTAIPSTPPTGPSEPDLLIHRVSNQSASRRSAAQPPEVLRISGAAAFQRQPTGHERRAERPRPNADRAAERPTDSGQIGSAEGSPGDLTGVGDGCRRLKRGRGCGK